VRAFRGPAFALTLIILGFSSISSSAREPQPTPQEAIPRNTRQTARLRQDLRAVLAAPILARSAWSIRVKSLDRGDVIFDLNAGKLLTPASNMKILTMAAAAERLGWDHRFETTLESAAPVRDGVLDGDLIVRGGGDPSIALREDVAGIVFDTWAQELRAADIREISGRIVTNDGALDDVELGAGWAWDDMAFAYSGPVSAAFYNEALVRITLHPGDVEEAPAAIELSPPYDHGLAVLNQVTTGAAGTDVSLDVRRERGSRNLTVRGRVPVDVDEPPAFAVSIENPALFFASTLKTAFIARGIQVSGGAADGDALAIDDPARSSENTRVLARHLSAPLTDTGRTFMKVSQNLYGELFVKAIGHAAGEGSTARGQESIRQTLDAWGVPRDSYILADGSGLSRLNYVSAEAVVRVLEQMHRDPRHRDNFRRTLPVAGEDGTLRGRLRAPWTAGRVQAKTGSLSYTRALSGYLVTRSGESVAFSILANNSSLPGWRLEEVIDLLVEILALY
jgi:D-alanyl-D-alanine carboxypeptidase/D-alanyl-D-alanine-endopeptidase (penicillin-binding protein 4)